jgi:opacity protein-like surface antigen
MKKILLVIVAVIGLSLNAQQKGNIEFGIGAGMSPFIEDGVVIFNVGGSADYYFSDRWSVKAKLAFDRKGWLFEGTTSPGVTFEYVAYANYLTLPVMANWHFGGKRNWYLNFGPYAGVLLNAKYNDFEENLTDDFDTFDFGIAAGVGVKIPVSDKLKICIEYEGLYGVVSVTEIWKGDTYTGRETLNVGVNFML